MRRNNFVHGKFTSGPMDPPPAFKAGWKAIRLEEALGSTSVNITPGTIRDGLQALGIAANSIRLLKVAVWVQPGTAANTNLPQVILALRCPLGKGALGTRVDTGQLSRAAHVQYSFSQTIRNISIDLPTAGQQGDPFASISSSAATGVFQVSLEYNI